MEDTYEKFSLVVARFQELREQAAAVSNLEGHFTTTEALTAYRAINAAMAANGGAPTDSTLGWTLVDESPGILEARPRTELQLRGDALIAAIEEDSAASPAVGTGAGGNTDTRRSCKTPASNSTITNGSAGFPGLEARWRTAHDCAA
ncbi:hypothetical protein [Candidatus Accumulibacter sp. ACC007]|uniref:hypothetical protein n=1 Tax=Candidatus Accumulibacter sp. ACC007 TaxID=2823333 RepID=UPI0025BA4831|nr:hypothetical protein [Candidatus Accumulibacter sp. ACC007]